VQLDMPGEHLKVIVEGSEDLLNALWIGDVLHHALMRPFYRVEGYIKAQIVIRDFNQVVRT